MTQQRHILLIDADNTARFTLARQLAHGLDAAVSEAGSIAEAATVTGRGQRVDAIILDVALPDGDGRDYCESLRMAGCNMPVLVLTARTRESDVVRGLDAGANDYVAKPCGAAELLARLRAQLRAFETSEHAEIAIGPFVFRPGAKQLLDDAGGRPIRLTEKEAAVLKYLYRAAGAPVRKESLLHDIWGYSPHTTTHTVETHIYRLRRKIEPHPTSERLLINEAGGYRLRLARPRPRWPARVEPAEVCYALAS